VLALQPASRSSVRCARSLFDVKLI
jgi:hypothetical protein